MDIAAFKQIEALTVRIHELETELGAARASLVSLRSHIEGGRPAADAVARTASPALFCALPESDAAGCESRPSSLAPILLPPLPMHDVLRRKWRLGAGLARPEPAGGEAARAETPQDSMRADGYLRLFGLLTDGRPWEKEIPFADLAKNGGVTLGRDPLCCDIALPESSVSRCHARLELGPQGLVVSDLGSTNGVCVNGERLAGYASQAPLSDGMTLELGENSLRVEMIRNCG